MRIAIDCSSATVGAGAVYSKSILKALAHLDQTNDYTVLVSSRHEDLVPSQKNFSRVSLAPRWAALRVPIFQAVLPWWLKRQNIDVLISPFEYTVLGAPCPVVLGMQSLSPYSSPVGLRRTARARVNVIRALAWLSVRRAAAMFFLSDASRVLICKRLKIGTNKAVVIPYGVDLGILVNEPESDREPEKDFTNSIPARFILSVSAVYPYKDFESLLRAFANVLERLRLSHHLVIAGPIGDRAYLASLQCLVSELRLDGKVNFLGKVGHRAVGRLCGQADAMVLPSHVETFGLPIVEAMACRTPVIASDIPALREVGDEAGLYYQPGDHMGLSRQLERVLTDDLLRFSMIEAGCRRAAMFSWDSAASALLGLATNACAGSS